MSIVPSARCLLSSTSTRPIRFSSSSSSSRLPFPAVRSYATAGGEKDELVVKLQSGLKEAMRAKDKFRSQVLKSALADIQTFQHQEKPPAPVSTLLSSLTKRRDAVKAYSAENRTDLVEQFEQEIAILEQYLPEEAKEMGLEELNQLVESVLKELGIVKGSGAAKDLGRVIKEVRARAGMRVQNLGKQLSESVKQALS